MAQESGSQPKAKTDDSIKRATSAYRLNLTLVELENGKKINTRQYTMNLTSPNDGNDLRIGARVPVESKQGEFQYIDVGTHVSCRFGPIRPDDPDVTLHVNAEISSFATPDQQSHGAMPLLRQLNISGSTILVTDKPMMIGSVDDPNSNREFLLEVTATRLK